MSIHCIIIMIYILVIIILIVHMWHIHACYSPALAIPQTAWWWTRSRIIRAKTLPGTESSVTPRELLQSWRSPFPFERETTRPLFQSVGMMPVFQAEHRTASNESSAAFPPALRSSAWMPQIPGALPHFNRFTAACFHKRRWTTFDWMVSNRDGNTPDIQLNSWWISLLQPLKVTVPVCLHSDSSVKSPHPLL